MRAKRPRRALLVVLLAAMLPACTRRRADVAPPVAMPGQFADSGTGRAGRRWWTRFDDATLDALVRRALRDNFTLRTAWNRLDQARAVADKSAAPLLPAVDAAAGASRTVQRTSGAAAGAGGGATTYTTELSPGVSAGYEVDLWHRVRSVHDAARLDADASAADLHAAAITLSAQVARTWFRLSEQHGQDAILREQLATNEAFLEVITARFRQGRVSAADVLQQRELVEEVRGLRAQVASRIDVLRHQLAILTGRAPGATAPDVPASLPELPPLPSTGIPAELIRRRPDVRAAELRIQAADQRLWAAIADQYPRLTLSADASTSTEKLRDLFDNWVASIAANMTAPLFDAGLRRAEVERTRAVLAERLNTYGQTVLDALGEVSDALSAERRQAEFEASLRERADLARLASERTRLQYIKGTGDFTRYLTSVLSYQQLQRALLQARRDLLLDRIDLYRALAGDAPLQRPPATGSGAGTPRPTTAPGAAGASERAATGPATPEAPTRREAR
ncbi:MAG: efflux transporter outer membrane subunit [Planctomycetota bacterium]